MAFNCVSRVGLTISGGYVPKELQELIANFWLPNRYKDKYVDVLRELVYELKPHKWFWKPIRVPGQFKNWWPVHAEEKKCEIYPINNIRATKVQILLDKFNKYDEPLSIS